jgi:phosphoesterase RecJ-like protein
MPIDAQHYRDIAVRISEWRRPLLLTHTRPDGDAVGCLLAMRALLRRAGSDPQALWLDGAPARYAFLWDRDPVESPSRPASRVEALKPDGVILVDTCAYAQLGPLADWLGTGHGARLPKIALDHHQTRDPIGPDVLIDESASAASVIVLEWAEAAGWTLPRAAADALLVGIATDTGWFRYSSTDARTLEAAARLTRCGADPSALYEAVYAREPAARLRLEAACIQSMELRCGGRIALMTLGPAQREAAGGIADTSDIVNLPLRIETVQVSVLLAIESPGQVRVSLRSKPPGPGVPDVNVADIAAILGGGGHARAAGARVPGDLTAARVAVLATLEPKVTSSV